MYYQLPNGKTIYLTIEEYLDLTDSDIQYLVSLDSGQAVLNPFYGSSVNTSETQKFYDFEHLSDTDDEVLRIPSDDTSFDDLIDLSEPLDI